MDVSEGSSEGDVQPVKKAHAKPANRSTHDTPKGKGSKTIGATNGVAKNGHGHSNSNKAARDERKGAVRTSEVPARSGLKVPSTAAARRKDSSHKKLAKDSSPSPFSSSSSSSSSSLPPRKVAKRMHKKTLGAHKGSGTATPSATATASVTHSAAPSSATNPSSSSTSPKPTHKHPRPRRKNPWKRTSYDLHACANETWQSIVEASRISSEEGTRQHKELFTFLNRDALQKFKDEFGLNITEEEKHAWKPLPSHKEDVFGFCESGPPQQFYSMRRAVHRAQGMNMHTPGHTMSCLLRNDVLRVSGEAYAKRTAIWQALQDNDDMDDSGARKARPDYHRMIRLQEEKQKIRQLYKGKKRLAARRFKNATIREFEESFKSSTTAFGTMHKYLAFKQSSPSSFNFSIYSGVPPKSLVLSSKGKGAADERLLVEGLPFHALLREPNRPAILTDDNGKRRALPEFDVDAEYDAEGNAGIFGADLHALKSAGKIIETEEELPLTLAELTKIKAYEKKISKLQHAFLKAKQIVTHQSEHHHKTLSETKRWKAVITRSFRIQLAIARRDIPRAAKQVTMGRQTAAARAKKLAYDCQRHIRRTMVKDSLRREREKSRLPRKLTNEMLLYWKRNEKLERERRKRAERELQEKLKRDQELREEKRQQRKFNFLITQTELYAHFMQKKVGAKPGGEGDSDEKTQEILSKLDATPVPTSDPSLAEHTADEGALGGDGDLTDEQLKIKALQETQLAVQRQQARMQQFDSKRTVPTAAERSTPGDGNGNAGTDAVATNAALPQAPATATEPAVAVDGDAQTQFDEQYSLANPTAAMDGVTQPSMLRGTLKKYQLQGLRWLANLFAQGINGILADEMGLGKTVQSIATLAYLAEVEDIWGPFIVVTPASTLNNWCDEILKFCPDFKVIPYWGTKNERKILRTFWSASRLSRRSADMHVTVTSYDMVVRDAKYIGKIEWQYMILDEAQAIKSSSSHRWSTLLKFNCRNRLLLTGTPIQNTMAELWALLHFIMPTLFDSHAEFNQWFSKDIENHAAGNANKLDATQLHRLHMILKPFMLRRVKTNVENELPDKKEVLVRCHFTPRQRRLYRRLKDNVRVNQLVLNPSSKRGADAQVSALMNLVMQFRKVCNHPNLLHRRLVRSPFVFEAPRWKPRPESEALVTNVNYTTQSPIEWHLPRLVFDAFVREGDGGTSFSHRNWFLQQLSVHHKHHVVHAMYTSSARMEPHGGAVAAPAATRALVLPRNTTSYHLLEWEKQDQHQHQHQHQHQPPVAEAPELRQISPLHACLVVGGVSAEETFAYMSSTSMELLGLAYLAHAHASKRGYALGGFGGLALRACGSGLGVSLFTPRGSLLSSECGLLPRLSLIAELEAVAPRVDQILPHVVAPPSFPACNDNAFGRWLSRSTTGAFDPFTASLGGACDMRLVSSRKLATSALGAVPSQGLLSYSRPRTGWCRMFHHTIEDLIRDSGKLRQLDLLLSKLKREGHRVLIYSQMTRMISILEELMKYRKHKYMRLDGSCKISDRRDMVADFQNREEYFAFILSTRAGGVGINLTAADTVIFYDSDWNPTVDQQAMDRAHRLGQTRQVTVYRLVTKGSIEERILHRANEKSKVQQLVIQGGSHAQDKMKSSEVMSLLMEEGDADGGEGDGNGDASDSAGATGSGDDDDDDDDDEEEEEEEEEGKEEIEEGVGPGDEGDGEGDDVADANNDNNNNNVLAEEANARKRPKTTTTAAR